LLSLYPLLSLKLHLLHMAITATMESAFLVDGPINTFLVLTLPGTVSMAGMESTLELLKPMPLLVSESISMISQFPAVADGLIFCFPALLLCISTYLAGSQIFAACRTALTAN
jgi:hypothetical protein